MDEADRPPCGSFSGVNNVVSFSDSSC